MSMDAVLSLFSRNDVVNGAIRAVSSCSVRLNGLATSRKMLLMCFTIVLTQVTPSVSAQGLLNEAEALSGLPGLYILGGDVNDVLISYEITKDDLISGVTEVLTAASVPVLDEMNWLTTESAPVVHIDLRSENGVFRAALEVLYLVHPVSNPDETTYAVVWSKDVLGQLSGDVRAATAEAYRTLARTLADDFMSYR